MVRVYDITVILPTLNEAECIGTTIDIIEQVFTDSGIDGEILVVDDNSRDATIAIVQQRQQHHANLRYLVRTADPGLSRSIIDGFAHAQSDRMLVTDADLQHDVSLIPNFLVELDNHDLVIGSRYTAGGGIEQWPLNRRIISIGATALGRLLFPDITDPVSGFFAVNRTVVQNVDLRGRGYKICMDILTKGNYASVCELPYQFTNRKKGSSKLRLATIREYILQVGELVAYTLTHAQSRVWDEWWQILRFVSVGVSGMVVNWGSYGILSRMLGMEMLTAALVAIECSIISNFLLHDRWTFASSSRVTLRRFGMFQGISTVGMVIQMLTFSLLVAMVGSEYDLLVYPAGILVAFVWNYLGNRHITWKPGTATHTRVNTRMWWRRVRP